MEVILILTVHHIDLLICAILRSGATDAFAKLPRWLDDLIEDFAPVASHDNLLAHMQDRYPSLRSFLDSTRQNTESAMRPGEGFTKPLQDQIKVHDMLQSLLLHIKYEVQSLASLVHANLPGTKQCHWERSCSEILETVHVSLNKNEYHM